MFLHLPTVRAIFSERNMLTTKSASPNLFETSPHVIDRIVDAISAIRVAIGAGMVMNYVWAGLFHPARRVRQPYWRLYNDAYVGGADSMVPYFPNLPNEDHMNRHELAIVL